MSPPSSALLRRDGRGPEDDPEHDPEGGGPEEDGAEEEEEATRAVPPTPSRGQRLCERGWAGTAAGLAVALCLGFAFCWHKARNGFSPLTDTEQIFAVAASLCTAEQGSNAPGSGCTENGQPDSDCCAGSGAGCAPGLTFTHGGVCHPNGALASCCKKAFAPSPPPHSPQTPTPSAPGDDWGCHSYDEGKHEDNDWCLRAGVVAGVEYRWVAGGGFCGDCWCCSRQAQGDGLATYPDGGGPMDAGLFCWLVSRSSGGEAALTRDHFAKKNSIFACDEWSVFTDGGRVDPVPSKDIGLITSKWASWGSYKNTGLFLRAWSTVLMEGKFSRHSWTVKADADAVWLPDRLRSHLRAVDAEAPLYIHNGIGGDMYLGPLEVFSNGAVKAFGAQWRNYCMDSIDVSGEDGYISDCMKKMKVPVRYDLDLLRTIHKPWACNNDAVVVFHPFKTVELFNLCLGIASR